MGVGFIIDCFATSYRFESVCVCGFIIFSLSFFPTFLLYFLDRPLEKHICNFFVSLSTLSLSLCLQLIFPPSFYIKHFPHFCLRISLICVGGCLVCVLIIFYLLHLLLLAIFFSWFIFFLFNLTFDFFFREGLIIFFTHTIYRWSSCLQSVFSVVTLSHHLHSFCFCIWGARVGWEGFFSLDNSTHDSLFFSSFFAYLNWLIFFNHAHPQREQQVLHES